VQYNWVEKMVYIGREKLGIGELSLKWKKVFEIWHILFTFIERFEKNCLNPSKSIFKLGIGELFF
jgi:hypothetical protein